MRRPSAKEEKEIFLGFRRTAWISAAMSHEMRMIEKVSEDLYDFIVKEEEIDAGIR